MNKQLSYVLYAVLGIVMAALLVMTVIASAGGNLWGGMTTVVILFLMGLAIAVAVVAFNPRKGFYSIGFYLAHIGIVMFLVGSLLYSVGGYSVTVAVPDGGSITPLIEYQMIQKGLTSDDIASLKGYYNQIPGRETDEVTGQKIPQDLGFNLRITDFVTEYYDEEQKNVKHYEATVEILYDDGTVETKSLSVNNTLHINGWKLYLMDVGIDDVYGYGKVHITFKNDPAEFLSTLGIVIIIIGTFMMCLIRPREKDTSSRKGKVKTVRSVTGSKKGGVTR
ncbi:MAG: cytochrome c biogenesis protein ResB [Ruminococcaceae bacterium]|nr:cytochrome c biogenesis protein ResB [Oscillospiraceae bacterium]